MNWISNWIQGIIIAVIIGTIIEMLLPEGNCKKYVKVVIGVYILFSIFSFSNILLVALTIEQQPKSSFI